MIVGGWASWTGVPSSGIVDGMDVFISALAWLVADLPLAGWFLDCESLCREVRSDDFVDLVSFNGGDGMFGSDSSDVL